MGVLHPQPMLDCGALPGGAMTTPFQVEVQRGITIFHLVAHFVLIQLETFLTACVFALRLTTKPSGVRSPVFLCSHFGSRLKPFLLKLVSTCARQEECSFCVLVRKGWTTSRSEAPISPSRTEKFGFRVGADAKSNHRSLVRAIPVDGWTSCRSSSSHGFGDCGHSFGTHGSLDRRSRRQKTSCGKGVEFCWLSSSRKCARHSMMLGRPVTLANHGFSNCVVL